jgi:hypothetical protein
MGRNVRFFRNTCPTCFNDVGIPLLGNFAYGEFVYQTDDGKNYAYVSSFTEQAWERIAAVLREHAGMKLDKNDGDITLYQHIMIRCADPINGRQFTTTFPLCPKCGGKITSYGDNTTMFDKHVDDATWKAFMQYKPEQQVARVMEILKNEKDGQQNN